MNGYDEEAGFRRVGADEVRELSRMAAGIVREHFDPLIGVQQNTYMIGKFQSPEAIRGQLAHGYRYYWVLEEDRKAGFLAFYPRGEKMYLSKFYLLREFRGKGLADRMMEFVLEETRREGLTAVYLNVNRGNTGVIEIYRHLGFQVVRKEKNDIGQGYYMDDYVLEYSMKN